MKKYTRSAVITFVAMMITVLAICALDKTSAPLGSVALFSFLSAGIRTTIEYIIDTFIR